MVDQRAVEEGLTRLRTYLASGRWHDRYGALSQVQELDAGLRLVIAD